MPATEPTSDPAAATAAIAAATAAAIAATNAAIVSKDIEYIKRDIGDIKSSVKEIVGIYVTREEFKTVKMIVYGMVGLILVAFVGGLISLIFIKH